MRNKAIKIILAVLILSTGLLFTGCGNGNYAETGSLIISADEALSMAEESGWLMLDAQKKTSFEKEHLSGAVNIERAEITVKTPVPNSLAPGNLIAEVAGNAGLTAESNVIIYDDNNNMDSGRLAWTLMIYGHNGQIKIVSGGLAALKNEGAEIVAGAMSASKASYTTGPPNPDMITGKNEILNWLNNPSENIVILDVRSDEEYNNGTIPGAVHIDYLENNFNDGTYKSIQHIKIMYKEAGIMPEDTVIMFCKSSIRAAQTYAALYNAGYRNLRIYDGAWLEWSADSNLPVFKPVVPGQVQLQVEDAS
ncbi:MAG: sulfurtransferase [Spirochaetales bacterium]|nr:sulfurtransferase [Spirochaetales bacterium]